MQKLIIICLDISFVGLIWIFFVKTVYIPQNPVQNSTASDL